MGEIWYRGQSTTAAPSKPGGSIHDFGDGLYLTDTVKVAETYATTRANQRGGAPEVLKVDINLAEMRVLDLRNDARWNRYMTTPVVKGSKTPLELISGRNEYYNQIFQNFLDTNRINIKNYDAVIGPENVRGGNQLCILHKNGQPAPAANAIRARLQPIDAPLAPAPKPASFLPTMPGRPLTELGHKKGIAGNREAMAMVGILLGGFFQSLGDMAIGNRVQELITTTNAPAIRSILGTGQGVLVVIAMQEWEQPDFNGMRARGLINVSVQGGRDQASALHAWQNTPRLVTGAVKGWRRYEQYVWISPAQ